MYFSQAEKKNMKPFQLFTIARNIFFLSVFIPIANPGGLLLSWDPTFQLCSGLFCFSCWVEYDPTTVAGSVKGPWEMLTWPCRHRLSSAEDTWDWGTEPNSSRSAPRDPQQSPDCVIQQGVFPCLSSFLLQPILMGNKSKNLNFFRGIQPSTI